MKMRLSKNKGYTLVEMIIVIAMIIVLATMSLVSITIINSARVKSACVRVGSEINEIKMINKNMTPSTTGKDGYGLVIYTDSNGVVNCCSALRDSTTKKYSLDTNNNVTFSSSVEVRFTGYRKYVDAGTPESVTDQKIGPLSGTGDKALLITFDKRGNCTSGYGDIYFHKKNGNQVAKIHITSNGSIDVR